MIRSPSWPRSSRCGAGWIRPRDETKYGMFVHRIPPLEQPACTAPEKLHRFSVLRECRAPIAKIWCSLIILAPYERDDATSREPRGDRRESLFMAMACRASRSQEHGSFD